MLRMALDFSVLMCQAPKTCTRKCISEILLAFFLCAHPPFETVSVIAHICNRTLRSSRICSERSSVFVFFCHLPKIYISSHNHICHCGILWWAKSGTNCGDHAEYAWTLHTVFRMHRCQWFLLSHYHKLWFIGIVARRQRDMITQSSGT